MPAALSVLWLLFANLHGDTRSLAVLHPASGLWELRVDIDADRAMQSLGVDRPDGTAWTVAEVHAREPELFEYLAAHLRLRRDGEAWPLRPLRVELREGPRPLFATRSPLRLLAHFALEAPGHDIELQVDQDLFLESEAAHQHRFRWEPGAIGGEASEFELDPELDPELDKQGGEWAVFVGAPLVLHLGDPTVEGRRTRRNQAFLAGLEALRALPWPPLFLAIAVLGAPSLLASLWIGACFLILCALTAALSATELLQASPALVALAAPFAVLYVATENLLSKDRRLRWATAGLFGCVLGLALGALLRDFKLPGIGRRDCALAYIAGMLCTLSLAFLAWLPISRWLSSARPGAELLGLLCSILAASWALFPLVTRLL